MGQDTDTAYWYFLHVTEGTSKSTDMCTSRLVSGILHLASCILLQNGMDVHDTRRKTPDERWPTDMSQDTRYQTQDARCKTRDWTRDTRCTTRKMKNTNLEKNTQKTKKHKTLKISLLLAENWGVIFINKKKFFYIKKRVQGRRPWPPKNKCISSTFKACNHSGIAWQPL